MEVPEDKLIQCVLGVEGNRWLSQDCVETAARLIALVVEREGADRRGIIDTIREQTSQDPQQRHHLIYWLTNDLDNFEQILEKHGL